MKVFPCNSQNLSDASKRSLLRMRLSLHECEQPDSRRTGLSRKGDKKRKALLKEPRAWLELGCRSSWSSCEDSADPAGKQQRCAKVFLLSVS
jgi:hypothetical protein